ncbi:MAG: hypothetical protein M1839_007019 [Geoglossum umbratile]|nr:MAG: hypothetical protein M1839_007019 [Geoglossum umbratile]
MVCGFCNLRHLALLALVPLRVLGQQLDAKLSFGHESPNTHPEFVASLEFRVNGPDGGDGSLHIWYEMEGREKVGSSTVYTIDKYDGLALVIDNYGGKGGSIRAFLNDGSTDYKTVQNIDSLTFGHCNFHYRNLGRTIELKLIQTYSFFKVEIDGWECFSSNTIKLPHNYYFGLVASSASNPDSFEAFKFSVNSDTHIDSHDHQQQHGHADSHQSPRSQEGSAEQFDRLNNRLDELTRLISKLDDRASKLSENSDKHYEELIKSHARIDRLAHLNMKLETIERTVYAIKADVEGREFKEHLTSLRQTVEDTHSSLMRHLPQTLGHIVTSAAPRMSVIIFLFLITQVILFGIYVLYKRRLKMQPKKYL